MLELIKAKLVKLQIYIIFGISFLQKNILNFIWKYFKWGKQLQIMHLG